MWRILRMPRIRLYFLGDAVSTLGDYALWMALGIWVKELTGSSAQAGTVFLMLTLGSLTAPLGGLAADRFRRKPLLIAVYLATAAMILALTFVHDRGQVWLIDVVVFCYGVSSGVTGAAQTALLPSLVEPDLLAEANGLLQTQTQGLRLVTPLVGAGLFVVAGGHAVVVVDAVSFLIAAALLVVVPVTEARPALSGKTGEGGKHWLADTTAGMRHLVTTVVLRQQALAFAAAMLVVGFMEPVSFSVATDELHKSAGFLGFLVFAQGIGAVVGGPTAAPILHRVGGGRLIAGGLLAASAGVLMAAVPAEPVVMAGYALVGLALPWIIVGFMTTLQLNTPPELLGRADGAAGLLIGAPQALSIAIGSALIAAVAYRDLIYVTALVLTASGLYLATRRAQRPGRTVTAAAEEEGLAEAVG